MPACRMKLRSALNLIFLSGCFAICKFLLDAQWGAFAQDDRARSVPADNTVWPLTKPQSFSVQTSAAEIVFNGRLTAESLRYLHEEWDRSGVGRLRVTGSEGGEGLATITFVNAWYGYPLEIVIDGDCYSACSLFLLHSDVKITPRARLYFHNSMYAHASGWYYSPEEVTEDERRFNEETLKMFLRFEPRGVDVAGLGRAIYRNSKPTRKVFQPNGQRLFYEGRYEHLPDWWSPKPSDLLQFGLHLEEVSE
jgi:hypothetical protein